MRIAYISYEYPPDTGFGGIGTYTWQIAKAMVLQNCKVDVFTASQTREVTEQVEGVCIHRLQVESQNQFNTVVVNKFKQIHSQTKFNLIECAENGVNAIEIVKAYPEIPLVVRLHTPSVLVTRMQNTYVPLLSKFRFVLGALLRGKIDLGFWSKYDKNQHKDLEYNITLKAKLITGPSQDIKIWANRFWGIDLHNIEIIPNPYLPTKEFLNIPLENSSKTITFYGRLNVLKGCVALTYAIKKVLKKHPKWSFKLIGKNETSHIDNLDMKSWMLSELSSFQSNIEILDWIDYQNIPKILSETEICVFPSLFESFSYTCCEAMSAGRAVVGSRNGGMKELLAGNCGLLINPENPNEIANALCEFIEDKNLRITYGQNARQKVLEKYSLDKIGSATKTSFKKLI
ncbi:MAG: glycogen(starch) synthase [Psychroserpens sp.]|jgi:glycogen(starch) synthase